MKLKISTVVIVVTAIVGIAALAVVRAEPQKKDAPPTTVPVLQTPEGLMAAIATAKTGMTPDGAWAVVEAELRSYCKGRGRQIESLPVELVRSCSRVEPTGMTFSETATLMAVADIRKALKRGDTFLGAQDENGLVMDSATAVIIAADPKRTGQLRLAMFEGTGKAAKDLPTVTWGPRNVDVSFAGPATISMKRRSSGVWDCQVRKGSAPGVATPPGELVWNIVFLQPEPMVRFVGALGFVWPDAVLEPILPVK
jgi:hypothetical protein